MDIKNLKQAQKHAREHLDKDRVVVSSAGDISINGDIDEVVKGFEEEGKSAFIVKGKSKKSKKLKDNEL